MSGVRVKWKQILCIGLLWKITLLKVSEIVMKVYIERHSALVYALWFATTGRHIV